MKLHCCVVRVHKGIVTGYDLCCILCVFAAVDIAFSALFVIREVCASYVLLKQCSQLTGETFLRTDVLRIKRDAIYFE